MKRFKQLFKKYTNPELLTISVIVSLCFILVQLIWPSATFYYLDWTPIKPLELALGLLGVNVFYAFLIWTDTIWQKKFDNTMDAKYGQALRSAIQDKDPQTVMDITHKLEMAKLDHYARFNLFYLVRHIF